MKFNIGVSKNNNLLGVIRGVSSFSSLLAYCYLLVSSKLDKVVYFGLSGLFFGACLNQGFYFKIDTPTLYGCIWWLTSQYCIVIYFVIGASCQQPSSMSNASSMLQILDLVSLAHLAGWWGVRYKLVGINNLRPNH